MAINPALSRGIERNSGGTHRVARVLPASISATRVAGARGRLAFELRSIALDLLGLYDSEELPPECADWVGTAVETAVGQTCEPTLASLVSQLRTELATAPAEIARRIDEARRRHEAGYA